MSIPEQTPFAEYTGDGSVTVFAYPFLINDEAHLAVYLDGALQSSGFSVSDVGTQAGGNVTFVSAPATGVKVAVRRNIPMSRADFDYQFQGAFSADEVDRDFNTRVQQLQQLNELIGRSLSQLASAALTDPFDAGAKRIQNLADPVSDQDAATKAFLVSQLSAAQLETAGLTDRIGVSGPATLIYNRNDVDSSGNKITIASARAISAGGFHAYAAHGLEQVLTASDKVTIASGSFSPTWTGFSTDPIGDIDYKTILDASGNGMVGLFLDAAVVTGISNATTMSITGIPAALRPPVSTRFYCRVFDNGANREGVCSISTSGTITFQIMTVTGSRIEATTTGFTGSGSKGVARCQIIYEV